MEALAFDDLAHRVVQPIIVHCVGQSIGEFRARVGRLELEVDFEALARFLLVRPCPVVTEDRKSFESNRRQRLLRPLGRRSGPRSSSSKADGPFVADRRVKASLGVDSGRVKLGDDARRTYAASA
jgi:hypothetical protein